MESRRAKKYASVVYRDSRRANKSASFVIKCRRAKKSAYLV
jgi:hypothetical protein